MPIPARPDGDRAHPLAAAAALFRQLHDEIRRSIDGLTPAQLAFEPDDGANSIAVLIVHLLASEAEALSTIAGLDVSRDRDSEFVAGSVDLLSLLDAADDLLKQVTSRAPDLGRVVALPTLPGDETRPAMTWLIATYGHAREHYGQLLLTKQLALKPTPH